MITKRKSGGFKDGRPHYTVAELQQMNTSFTRAVVAAHPEIPQGVVTSPGTRQPRLVTPVLFRGLSHDAR